MALSYIVSDIFNVVSIQYTKVMDKRADGHRATA